MLSILLFTSLGGWLSYNLVATNDILIYLEAIVGFIAGIFVTIIISKKLLRWELVSVKNLVPLYDDSPPANRFYVGRYAVGPILYFVYLRHLADGGYTYCMLHKENVVIYYDEKLTGGILEQHRFIPPAWSRGWLTFWEENYFYKFRIPIGGIKENFRF